MRLPEFITFTGADDQTSVEGMEELASQYPIEWGILFSPSRQGTDPRYPGIKTLTRFYKSFLTMAAHLCGGYSQAIMDGEQIDPPIDLRHFQRIQINNRTYDPLRVRAFSDTVRRPCIVQTRDTFEGISYADCLYDVSGGRGIEPAVLPPYPGRFVGYAGGIGPDNVLSVIERIAATGRYWIDMETKVRTDDRFDLNLCRKVCEAVYGTEVDVTR